MNAEGLLLEVVGALRQPGRLTGRLHGRQEQADEHCQDRDHDQELDQRDAAALRPPGDAGRSGGGKERAT